MALSTELGTAIFTHLEVVFKAQKGIISGIKMRAK